MRARGATLVRWLFEPARIQAWSAIVVAVATIVLVVVTWRYVQLTHGLVQAQTEPQVSFEFDQGRREVVLANQGIDRIIGVAVKVDTAVVAGPPENALLFVVQTSPEIPGRKASLWWDVGTLEPGVPIRRGMTDIAQDALEAVVNGERMQMRQSNLSASKRGQILGVLAFRLTFRREVDRRGYRETRMVWVFRDSEDPKRPFFWNPDLGPGRLDKLLELVPSPRR